MRINVPAFLRPRVSEVKLMLEKPQPSEEEAKQWVWCQAERGERRR